MKMENYISDRIQIAVFETRMGDGRYDLYILLDGRLARPALRGIAKRDVDRVTLALLAARETENMERKKEV